MNHIFINQTIFTLIKKYIKKYINHSFTLINREIIIQEEWDIEENIITFLIEF